MKRDEYIMLRALKNAPESIKSMTVGDYVKTLAKKAQAEQKDVDKYNDAICKEFKGTYIKTKIIKGTFGNETKYFHIKDIEPGAMTNQYKRLFNLTGQKVLFSKAFTSVKELKPDDSYDYMDADDLRGAEKITQEEYEAAKAKCEEIESLTNSMI